MTTYTLNKYKILKHDYIFLKTIVHIGGSKNKNEKQCSQQLTTYDFKLSNNVPSTMTLSKPKIIKKIGSFDVVDKVVVGDTDYNELDLKSGKYNAYQIDEHLMIIHNDLNIIPDKSISKWTWHHSGKGVGVDTGSFGFFDLNSIHKINNIVKIKQNNNNSLPLFEYVKGIDRKIVDGTDIDNFMIDKDRLIAIENKLKNLKPFGVISITSTGDGVFECYVIDNDRALLVGFDI